MKNYDEALEHFYNTYMLNAKGLREHVKLLRNDISELKQKQVNLENDLQREKYKGKAVK